MQVGDIVRFNAAHRSRTRRMLASLATPAIAHGHKFENGIVIGYFRGGFNDGEPVGPNGETALKVVFPSKVGEFRRSCLELVSAAG